MQPGFRPWGREERCRARRRGIPRVAWRGGAEPVRPPGWTGPAHGATAPGCAGRRSAALCRHSDHSVLRPELEGVGRGAALGCGGQPFEGRQHVQQQFGAQPGKCAFQCPARRPRLDGNARLPVDRARIQPLLHPHDGHAGLRIAGDHCPFDRRRATPARQQGGVDVDAPETRVFQRPAGQQQSVGGNHERIDR